MLAGAAAYNGMNTKIYGTKDTFESYQLDLTILLIVGNLYLFVHGKIRQGLETV